MSEIIVIVSKNGGEMANLQARYRVLGILPPNLLLIEISESETHALRSLPGIQAVIAGPTETIPDSLNDTERLFVLAWQKRQQVQEKQRRGEGQNWDAEGFLPPDLPNTPPAD